jgi:phosphoribosylformylglycinamidine cyclo-ligase
VTTYREAGVNLDSSDAIKESIASRIKRTFSGSVVSKGGEFGGVYRIPESELMLVASIDGVGTKIKVAILAGVHNTVGQDLVNHCVNDIAVMGATPAVFLDYLAFGSIQPAVTLEIIDGLSLACSEHGVSLIGGETAQMPGFYSEGDYDLAGAIIGFLSNDDRINCENLSPGDVVIGFRSNGLHTNGYSLARRIVFEINKWRIDTFDPELGCTWGEELLKIHSSYYRVIRQMVTRKTGKAFAHITGGGLPGNVSRVIPQGLSAVIETSKIPRQPIFSVLEEAGRISREEMYRAFNMGIGMVAIVNAEQCTSILDEYDKEAVLLGEITGKEGRASVVLV